MANGSPNLNEMSREELRNFLQNNIPPAIQIRESLRAECGDQDADKWYESTFGEEG